MIDVFAVLREQMLLQTGSQSADNFLIRGLWKTELLFKPNAHERTFRYTYLLAQTLGQGCCYCASDAGLEHSILGCDAREVITTGTASSIAVLDSIYASLPKTPAETYELRGNSVEKTDLRNAIIQREAERLVADKGEGARIVNVGVVGDLLRRLKIRYDNVFATDFDEVVVGMAMHGVTIEHGTRTLERVRNADVAIITGMTLATGTMGRIIETARESGTKLLVFAETGANFGEEYCQTLGIDCVVSEPFPFYIFQGVSRVEVFRREGNRG